MPMPLHHPKAGLLRTQSPLVGQHMLSLPIQFHRTSTPLARTLDGTLPHSYGSLVTLDPASLPPIPDPVAVAEIKRLIPQVLQPAEYKDVTEMVEALTADSPGTTPTADDVEAQGLASNEIVDGLFEDYTAEMAGAEFDAFLSQMSDQDFKDPPETDEYFHPGTQYTRMK